MLIPDHVISSFVKDRCFDADTIAGACWNVSLEFTKHCQQHSIDLELISLMDYIGIPFENTHTLWKTADWLCHNIVRFFETTYDFTFRQFDPSSPVPRVVSFDQIYKEWESVETETIPVDPVLRQKTFDLRNKWLNIT